MSIRTAVRAAAIASWSLLAACTSPAPVHIPDGQTYLSASKSYDGTTKTLAAQLTIDTLLTHPGAKLVSSLPFPGCPGMAGLATFQLPKAAPPSILLVGFTVRDGASKTVSYTRPKGVAADTGVMTAMRSVICQV
jgi:hypothetical protein